MVWKTDKILIALLTSLVHKIPGTCLTVEVVTIDTTLLCYKGYVTSQKKKKKNTDVLRSDTCNCKNVFPCRKRNDN